MLYDVKPNLTIDLDTLPEDFDVLYIINYFEKAHDYLKGCIERIVIEDNVFSPFVENMVYFKNWIFFNS